MKNFLEAVEASGKEKTKPYDTAATVTRIEGKTAWVHIDGGVDETPVQLTIDAKAGDTVRVRVSGGQAWLTGNGSAPPTDDTTAKRAEAKATIIERVVNTVKTVAEKAYQIAGNTDQYFWVTETGTDTGAHITEIPREEFLADPDNGGGNLLARSNGIAMREGMKELGQLSANGLNINSYDSNDNPVEIAHLGYGVGQSPTGTAKAPYYTLGTRSANSTVGNYSLASGYSVTASGFASAAIGWGCEATGEAAFSAGEDAKAQGDHSIALGYMVTAVEDNQVVIGRLNQNVSGKALVIGNGDEFGEGASNALTVDWGGKVWHSGDGIYNLSVDDFSTMDTAVFQSARVCVYGRMCQLFLELKTTSAVSAGHDIFTATLEDTNYIPAMYTTGVGYYGEHAIVGRINANGEIIVRNASASAVTLTNKVSLSFTYILP